jgi:CheY-like chemotaxis protein
MNIRCPHCGNLAVPAGHENDRAFYQCENCDRVWMTFLSTSTAADAAHAPMKVLLVDDSNDLLQLIVSWLDDEGYIVTTATSGMQAIDIAHSHDPDIVLLDVVIPPPDGFAVCESLLRRDRPPEIILMTGIADPLRLRRAGELGVLLRKPFTREVMVETVRQAALRRASAKGLPASG